MFASTSGGKHEAPTRLRTPSAPHSPTSTCQGCSVLTQHLFLLPCPSHRAALRNPTSSPHLPAPRPPHSKLLALHAPPPAPRQDHPVCSCTSAVQSRSQRGPGHLQCLCAHSTHLPLPRATRCHPREQHRQSQLSRTEPPQSSPCSRHLPATGASSVAGKAFSDSGASAAVSSS